MRIFTFFLCLWMAGFSLNAQTFRRYIFHNTPVWSCANEIYGLAGHFTDAGQTVSVLGTGYTHGPYLNFVSGSGYSAYTSKHYKTGSPLVPKSVYRTATHTYAVAAFLRGSTSDYLLFKFLNDGTLLSIKKVGEFPIHTIQAANIMLDSLPGTSELLLCYHTIHNENARLTSEIHLYSINENLVPTGTVSQKLAFTMAEEQNFNIMGNCGLYVADSSLYFNLLMDDANSKRFETGRLNMYTGEAEAQWCGAINATSYDQRNRVLAVKNDTVYHLVNSCLAVYPPGTASATYYPFNNEVFDCMDLVETGSGDWVGIFSDQVSTGAVGIFNPASGSQMPLYGYNPMLPWQMRAKDSLFSVWGKHENCALGLDEFTIPSVDQCHPIIQIDPVQTVILGLNSSAADVLAVTPVFTDVPLFVEANLLTTQQALCNTIMAVDENEPLQVLIYPNPTADLLHIDSEMGSVSGISLRNMAGITVFQNQSSAEFLTVDLTGFPAGMYVLEIQTGACRRFQKISKL